MKVANFRFIFDIYTLVEYRMFPKQVNCILENLCQPHLCFEFLKWDICYYVINDEKQTALNQTNIVQNHTLLQETKPAPADGPALL